ncbi:hypothetical protein M0R45_030837 [Rubus argutus]|uniref:Uncharacterized protein n=1 Tax=Rubus argutus TaxID=59490 RepID=A0AAW1WEP0_RUBAR
MMAGLGCRRRVWVLGVRVAGQRLWGSRRSRCRFGDGLINGCGLERARVILSGGMDWFDYGFGADWFVKASRFG